MSSLAKKMERVLDLCKLKHSRLAIPEGCENLRADFIRPGYKWMLEVESTVYNAFVAAEKFCSREVWEMYELLGEEDLVEVRDLKKALFNFRTFVISRKRPDFYKITKRAKLLKNVKSS